MRFTEIELQSEDLLWFAIDKNTNVLAFTTGGAGCVPEFVCGSKEKTSKLQDYFLDSDTDDYFNVLTNKGIICYDVNYDDDYGDSYIKASSPNKNLKLTDLPQEIISILKGNQLDIDSKIDNTIKVTHAYTKPQDI